MTRRSTAGHPVYVQHGYMYEHLPTVLSSDPMTSPIDQNGHTCSFVIFHPLSGDGAREILAPPKSALPFSLAPQQSVPRHVIEIIPDTVRRSNKGPTEAVWYSRHAHGVGAGAQQQPDAAATALALMEM